MQTYCESEGNSNKPQMESNCVLLGTENKSNYKSDTERDIRKNWNENELYDEIKVKSEHLVQNESQEFHIKHEVNEQVDDSGVEKLSNLLHLTTPNMLYCRNSYIDTNVVKKCQENEQNGETGLKRESFVEAEIHEFNVKHEEIDIKTDDEDTTRCEDNVLTPQDASVKTMYHCDICTFRTRHNSDLQQHMLIHKDASEVTMYSCKMCAYKTKLKGNLKIHMLASEVPTYSCGMCTYKTKRKDCLKNHMLIHKDAAEVTTYSCGVCAYKTKVKGNLNRHMLVHKNASEVTTYSCGVSTFDIKQKGGLKQHLLNHQDVPEVTTYSCGVCAYKTKLKGNLKIHMLVHKSSAVPK